MSTPPLLLPPPLYHVFIGAPWHTQQRLEQGWVCFPLTSPVPYSRCLLFPKPFTSVSWTSWHCLYFLMKKNLRASHLHHQLSTSWQEAAISFTVEKECYKEKELSPVIPNNPECFLLGSLSHSLYPFPWGPLEDTILSIDQGWASCLIYPD